jgi:hypothetical protein
MASASSLGLADQPDLEGKQTEQQVPVGIGGHRVCLRVTVQGRDAQFFAPASRIGPLVTADQSYYRILDLAIHFPLRQYGPHNRSPLPAPRPWGPVCLSTQIAHLN